MSVGPSWDFGERLASLIGHVPPPAGTAAWTNETIAQAVRDLGVDVTGNHIAHLRSGRRDNPSARLVGALATVFGVPVDFFFDQARAEAITEQLAALAELRGAQVMGVAGRGPVDVTLVAEVVRALQVIRGEKHDDDTSGGA